MTALYAVGAAYEIFGVVSMVKFCVDCWVSGEADVRSFTLLQWFMLAFFCLLTGPWMLLPERKVRP